ncbi:cytochrome d ubiquinol oxidase subunit II [Insolitispirillum peregrinum]|uniref:Cytochrome bd-I ubiquinol oxidase subunit 2 apoprotein n=1 Tax=Insolitispirillum peregrinum TaxID=80876 RepID=A0A1N7IVG8_9PROT|nr:cytochrome d ubiquinol oxidase subunit II [Insolitispirillum peregrinum]SIS41083.1 cytochrome bd-I ubiquinol oxidase subunit 2 apoprotein [Insolitispirillum peregrinum]
MIPSFLDYETLRLIWWLFLGVLLIGFAIMDGFDLGVGTLLPFIGRTDSERRVMINSIGPVWEGNQVWLILGGGAIFAAFPAIYSAAFSGFYIAMFLTLVGLIMRPVGFDYRNKVSDPLWRTCWDWALFVGGFVPSLIFGVAFGNLLQGVPFRLDDTLRVYYEGSFFGLLNPLGLLCGVLSVTMLAAQGAAYLNIKTEGVLQQRARTVGRVMTLVALALFILAGLWVASGVQGYAISSPVVGDGPSNPLLKTVVRETGSWMANYGKYPWMIAVPLVGIFAALAAALLVSVSPGIAFIANSLFIASVVATCGVSMFPFLMPSSLDPASSLTAYDATSSAFTLFVMLIATLIFLPIILAYTSFVFRVLRGKVTAEYVARNSKSLY